MSHFYSGMAHFYDCITDPKFLKDITTPAQARKNNYKTYPSVTTILSLVKDDFLDGIYRPRKLVELARMYPQLHWRDVETLVYGTREHPVTGDSIGSSEFGTAVHKCIEDRVNANLGGATCEANPYDPWADPFLEWIDESETRPLCCEHIIGSHTIKTAGSIDFMGYDDEDKLFLADYKCRSNTKGKAKTYPKDCEQLAIESYMVMKEYNLDYLPEAITICIDCDTKKHYHKTWTPKEMDQGIKNFKYACKLYWSKRMKK
jgi:hypothetical protein